ncbi:molybdate ABC transporter substrate-binding protein [Mumia sp. ZJ1417]|uniref:molybdate ABC transporter substrate-binding protein n=1 Tax=unclassified Mumia TaxID=2621872 RepID=UPI0014206636|nr:MULTISPECIES: molybdate ABC transporter substrate-binding protein [unclassified Mumia]QMW67210.1 molybdate ABC transporter substrate-binding protein [Mumia sp. ZJ1417]
MNRSPFRTGAGLALAAAATSLVLAGCGGADKDERGAARDRTLTVLAAASLTEAFDDLETVFEQQHDGVDVRLTYDSSAVLAEQVIQGAPADVLATADETTMRKVVEADAADGDPVLFASNTLVIATPPDNPGKVRGVQDLGRATFAVCVPQSPCGDAAQRLLALDGNTAKPTTEEQNVKGVLTKVTLGEVDAGLVYRSDAQAAGDDVETVEAENASEVVNVDPIVVLVDSQGADLGRDWVDLVTSKQGQKVLAQHGFGPAA